MNKYNLSASRLADRLSVPRSTVSHILSGRNKPSLDFVQKLLANFPELSAGWLVKGEGSMTESESNLFSQQNYKSANDAEGKLPESDNKGYRTETLINDPKLTSSMLQAPHDEVISRQKNKIHDSGVSQAMQTPHHMKVRRIIKLIAIYDDKTFDEYHMQKD